MATLASFLPMLPQIDVRGLLPQQPPFVMVGRLTHISDVGATTQTEIASDNLFADNGRFSAAGLMENMAQTLAARIGFINKYVLHQPVRVGVIGAVNNFTVNELPPVGSTIATTVTILNEVFGITQAEVCVECDGRTIATARIKTALPPE